MTYVVSLELYLDADSPQEAARTFFSEAKSQEGYLVVVTDQDGNFIASYGEGDLDDPPRT